MAKRAKFANAVISDQGPQNPKLGNRGPRRGGPTPPTSGQGNADLGERDYFRNPTTPQYNTEPASSITPERVTQSVRMRWNPIRGLTADRLVTYLDQWRLGFFRQAGMAWEQMLRRDYQLQIVAPKRMKSVARHGYDVLTLDKVPDGMEAQAEEQQEFLKDFWDHISVTTALNPDEQGGLSLLIRQMQSAVGMYYAVHEIVWQPSPDGTLTAKFIFCPIWWFEGTRGKLRFLDSEFQVYGNDMMDGEWLVTCGDGIMEACSVVYLFKHLPLRNWLSFLDKFAMPGLIMKTDAQKGSREWEDAVTALQQVATEYAAVVNRNCDLSMLEVKAQGTGGGLFDALVEKMDRALTQIWRGGDLGTSAKKDAVGASLQEDETEILENDDAKLIEETLTAKVSRYALAWKFGPETPQLAYIKLRTTPRQNLKDDVAVDTFLLGAGAPLGRDSTLERYNRPVPAEGEELLKAPAPQAPKPGDPSDPSDPSKGSEDTADLANESQFEANALHSLVKAAAQDLQPVRDRLAAILQIDDPAIFESRLRAFLSDLDKLKADLSHDPATAQALAEILSTGVANGMAKTKPTA